ncbi:MAG: hypothetical protein HY513_04865 [Candidatus Aenigmarchaeota archaeon]|nr:hypothetical protein [Candidatus Aenigmarchaeota archaeon]
MTKKLLPVAALVLAACGAQKAQDAPDLTFNMAYAEPKLAECEADLDGEHVAVYRNGNDRSLVITKNGRTEEYEVNAETANGFRRHHRGTNITLPFWHIAKNYACEGLRKVWFAGGEAVAFGYEFTGNQDSEAAEAAKAYFGGSPVVSLVLRGKPSATYTFAGALVDFDGDGATEIFNFIKKDDGYWAVQGWNGRKPSEVSHSSDMVERKPEIEKRLVDEALAVNSGADLSLEKYPLLGSLVAAMPGMESALISDLARYPDVIEPRQTKRVNPNGTITVSGSIEIDLHKLVEETQKKGKVNNF